MLIMTVIDPPLHVLYASTGFKGDHFMLQNSRKELRSKFEVGPAPCFASMDYCKQAMVPVILQANRTVPDGAAVKKLLAEGEEAASFIKTFVVQAKLNERGNFGRLTPCTATNRCRASVGPISLSLQDHSECCLQMSALTLCIHTVCHQSCIMLRHDVITHRCL